MSNFEFPEIEKPVIGANPEIVLETPVWSYEKNQVIFPGNVERTFHKIHKGGGVTIVPWESSNDADRDVLDHELYVIPQVRPNANNSVGWCFPAGGIDEIDNNSIEACAKRELFEESGIVAENVVDLGTQHAAVHFSDVVDTTVIVSDLTVDRFNPEATEAIGKARLYTIGELFEMTQRISPEGVPYMYDGISIAGLGKASLYIARKNRAL